MTDILKQIAAQQEASHQRVREIVREHGGEHAVAEYDAGMEHMTSGRHAMSMLWHSISEPQRRLVKLLAEGDRRLVRCSWSNHFYDARGEPHAVAKVAGLGTVSKLVRHGVLRWTGPERDETLKAELATRGYELIASLRARN